MRTTLAILDCGDTTPVGGRRSRKWLPFLVLLLVATLFVLSYGNSGGNQCIAQVLDMSGFVTSFTAQKSFDAFEPLLMASETDEWKRKLFEDLDNIRKLCGDLCTAVRDQTSHGNWSIEDHESPFEVRFEFPDVDCPALFMSEEIDAADDSVPENPPEELMPFYTLDGMIGFNVYGHLKNVYLGGEAFWNTWTEEGVNEEIERLRNGTLDGSYGVEYTTLVRDQLGEFDFSGKSVLVIGSEKPWLESACLLHGAASVTTLEYGKIHNTHPRIRTMTPDEFRNAFKKKRLGPFDVVVSFSSLEHVGLGRYGDQLNPWGDILAVARAWCVTKKDGRLFLGLPVGPDQVQWNAHRIYGKIRWPLVTANWKGSQPERVHELSAERWVHPGFWFTKLTFE